MTEEADSQEPTMEEILASIRRIISEDDEGAEEAAPVAEAEPEEVAEPEGEDDDVMELTDVVMAEPEEEPEPEPAAEPEPEEEIMDLEMAPEEEVVEEALSEPEPEEEFEAVVEEPDDDADSIDFALPEPEAEVEETPEPVFEAEPVVEAEPVSADEPLISGATEAATAAAFGALASSILTSSGDARTLEDLVADMLRPMLKDWMDKNLPSLVEQLVREEIERVARRGR